MTTPVSIALLFAGGLADVAADSRPASRPAGKIVAYQPGIRIDFANRQVEVAGTVVLREGLLELFACRKGIREHESILAIEARPLHVFEALGLIGLTPGKPPGWDPAKGRPIPPTGDRVEVLVRYEIDGRRRLVHACEWMAGENKPPDIRTWVFAGSRRTPDGEFLADEEGTVVTVVDFSEALLALPESHSADNDQLWLRANTKAIPPLHTRCTLILRPADRSKRPENPDKPATIPENAPDNRRTVQGSGKADADVIPP